MTGTYAEWHSIIGQTVLEGNLACAVLRGPTVIHLRLAFRAAAINRRIAPLL